MHESKIVTSIIWGRFKIKYSRPDSSVTLQLVRFVLRTWFPLSMIRWGYVRVYFGRSELNDTFLHVWLIWATCARVSISTSGEGSSCRIQEPSHYLLKVHTSSRLTSGTLSHCRLSWFCWHQELTSWPGWAAAFFIGLPCDRIAPLTNVFRRRNYAGRRNVLFRDQESESDQRQNSCINAALNFVDYLRREWLAWGIS